MRVMTKQAEKEYLARTGASEWERLKPFSPPAADTLVESARLLHDFAVAMLVLQPGPDELILDLGAGGCWCSDLLHKLNRRTVAVDIAVDMLQAGRRRPNGQAIRAVAGDMERLPFRTGVFSKAICLSAVHHVPDIGRAVGEIARVLDDEGIAFFSEPGRGHSLKPFSLAAMRDCGVLEQDIVFSTFAAQCRDAGFADVRLKAMSYAIPEFDLTPRQWAAWSNLARRKRPVRALEKMSRAALELFGIGKRTVLFEEALAMSLVRLLRGAMEDHPIIVASKREGGVARPPTYSASIEVERMPARVNVHSPLALRVRVRNLGTSAWKAASASGIGHITLGLQLMDAQGRLVARDFHRVPLPRDVGPNESVTLDFECPPPAAGTWAIKFDLVAEGVTWFENAGSAVTSRALRVE
jgi:SAM-dependent methyltransferase